MDDETSKTPAGELIADLVDAALLEHQEPPAMEGEGLEGRLGQCRPRGSSNVTGPLTMRYSPQLKMGSSACSGSPDAETVRGSGMSP